ncbi:hypothetical protein E6W39_38200 [Kitasatospora acidiphila]|uniref:Uncharacterized protein n=1 Tax=Kitasatospora acidiphila TaxID=2567942 RepID=A0A540WD58_9ACTN|nr:hypothetical protein [Kitasatospora acidiphila]TQF06956.1 hypothetical protein E6W39_38200 [Kitasatospora acidiphila]
MAITEAVLGCGSIVYRLGSNGRPGYRLQRGLDRCEVRAEDGEDPAGGAQGGPGAAGRTPPPAAIRVVRQRDTKVTSFR